MGIRPDNTCLFVKGTSGTYQPIVNNRCFCGELVDVLAPADDKGVFDWYISRIAGDSANGYGLYHTACDPVERRTSEDIADQAIRENPGKMIHAIRYWRAEFERVNKHTGELSTLHQAMAACRDAVIRQWSSEDLRTSDQWAKEYGIVVLDPDGWRSPGDPLFSFTKITRADFEKRAWMSTIQGSFVPQTFNREGR